MATNLTGLNGTIRVNANLTASKVDTFPSVPNDPISYAATQTITFGAIPNTSNQVYRASGTVAATATLDLTTGGLYNVFGQQINFSYVNALLITNTSTTDNLSVTWGSIIVSQILSPGGVLYIASDGMTASNIVFAESGTGSASYDIVIVGIQA